jgi:hypothetical protein
VTYIQRTETLMYCIGTRCFEFCRLSVSLTRENRLLLLLRPNVHIRSSSLGRAENSLRVRADAIDRRHLWMRRSQQL